MTTLSQTSINVILNTLEKRRDVLRGSLLHSSKPSWERHMLHATLTAVCTAMDEIGALQSAR